MRSQERSAPDDETLTALRRTAAALAGEVAHGDAAVAAVLARPPWRGGDAALLRALVRRLQRHHGDVDVRDAEAPGASRQPADLVDALRGLPFEERAVLLLVDLHRESLARAARTLHLRTGEAARWRLRALQALGEALGEDVGGALSPDPSTDRHVERADARDASDDQGVVDLDVS